MVVDGLNMTDCIVVDCDMYVLRCCEVVGADLTVVDAFDVVVSM